MKKSFLNHSRPWLTAFLMSQDADEAVCKVEQAIRDGADSIAIEITAMRPEFWNKDDISRIFAACGELPIYACCYRANYGESYTDDEIVSLMYMCLECGATLIDVMGDLYDPVPYELTENPEAVEKQKRLIADLKSKGAEVLMSSHNHGFYDTETTLHWAQEQENRGVDVVKIIGEANTEEELITNLKTYKALNANLKVPYLFMACGKWCMLQRECSGRLGAFMYLGRTFDEGDQPRLSTLKYMRDEMKFVSE